MDRREEREKPNLMQILSGLRFTRAEWVALGSVPVLALIAYSAASGATLWNWLQLLIVPATIAGFSIWFNWRQNKRENERERQDADRERKQREHDAMVNALQGEKESVAYVAYQVRRHGLNKLKGLPDELNRSELIRPLCLSAVYEGSDRTRALVLSALERCKQEEYDKEIQHTFDEIHETFCNYKVRIADQAQEIKRNLDIDKHLRMLEALYRALELEPPSRPAI